MKTTIDIADSLLERAKRQARRERRTLKEVMTEALRTHLERSRTAANAKPFRLRRHTMKGKGVRPPVAEGDWRTIRDLIYGGGETPE